MSAVLLEHQQAEGPPPLALTPSPSISHAKTPRAGGTPSSSLHDLENAVQRFENARLRYNNTSIKTSPPRAQAAQSHSPPRHDASILDMAAGLLHVSVLIARRFADTGGSHHIRKTSSHHASPPTVSSPSTPKAMSSSAPSPATHLRSVNRVSNYTLPGSIAPTPAPTAPPPLAAAVPPPAAFLHNDSSLAVWKQALGPHRTIICGSFVAPVTPSQYCAYASGIENRMAWDRNVSEARVLEKITEAIDVTYVRVHRVATISPRDYINLRVIGSIPVDHLRPGSTAADQIFAGDSSDKYHALRMYTDYEKDDTDDKKDGEETASFSLSCSLVHKKQPEVAGVVRADIKLACYFAIPLPKFETEGGECSTRWSRIFMFSDIDPKGWIAAGLFRQVAVHVLPRTVESIVDKLLSSEPTSQRRWRAERLYDRELNAYRRATSALDYVSLKYSNAMHPRRKPPMPPISRHTSSSVTLKSEHKMSREGPTEEEQGGAAGLIMLGQ